MAQSLHRHDLFHAQGCAVVHVSSFVLFSRLRNFFTAFPICIKSAILAQYRKNLLDISDLIRKKQKSLQERSSIRSNP